MKHPPKRAIGNAITNFAFTLYREYFLCPAYASNLPLTNGFMGYISARKANGVLKKTPQKKDLVHLMTKLWCSW